MSAPLPVDKGEGEEEEGVTTTTVFPFLLSPLLTMPLDVPTMPLSVTPEDEEEDDGGGMGRIEGTPDVVVVAGAVNLGWDEMDAGWDETDEGWDETDEGWDETDEGWDATEDSTVVEEGTEAPPGWEDNNPGVVWDGT